MMRFFYIPWWWMQRRMDVRMLWPICRDLSPSLAEAHEAFLIHAAITPCWSEYYSPEALVARVKELR